MTQWLNEQEQAAWLKLAAVMLKLSPALDSELQRDSGLTHFDYLCLAMLSEAEGHVRTMSDLATTVNSSLSRLSHVITKLEGRGWVQREPSPESRRVTLARLTEAGWGVVQAAAPGHVQAVRELVFDGLSEEDVAALERVAGHIAKRLEETDLKTTV